MQTEKIKVKNHDAFGGIQDERKLEVILGGLGNPNEPDKTPVTNAAMPMDPNYWCDTCQTITFHYGRKCTNCGH